jgi:hypothetical protein
MISSEIWKKTIAWNPKKHIVGGDRNKKWNNLLGILEVKDDYRDADRHFVG